MCVIIISSNIFAEDLSWVDNHVVEKLLDHRTIWYDETTMHRVFQDNNHLVSVNYNLAGKLDKTGSANNELPWIETSGVQNVNGLYIKRFLWMPVNQKIKLYNNIDKIKERGNLLKEWISGIYPNKSLCGQVFFTNKGIFSIRVLEKENPHGWHGWERNRPEITPVGYLQPDNCVDCHSDIGRDSFEIDPKRDWYGTVRGLEVGGPIHFHVFDTKNMPNSQYVMLKIYTDRKDLGIKKGFTKIADKFKSIVDVGDVKINQ